MDRAAQLSSTFEQFREALLRCDSGALGELLAEDYRGVGPAGEPSDRKMILEVYRPGGVRLDVYEVEELETRSFGPVGLITGRGRIHGEYGGSEFEHRVRLVDVYVERGAGWQLVFSQVTPLATL